MVYGGEDPRSYDLRSDIRPVLGVWDGRLATFGDRSVEYGAWQTAAWLLVHRMIHRYGEKKFIAFLNAVRDGEAYRDAADKHLGRSLKRVEADLRTYLRRHV